MPAPSVILWLASWYPNKLDAYTGDFIQRHAQALATLYPVYVLHIVRDESGKVTTSVHTETTLQQGVQETIIYYYIAPSKLSWLSKWRSRTTYMRLGKEWLLQFADRHRGKHVLVEVAVAMRAGLLALWCLRKMGWPYLVKEHWTGYYPEHQASLDKPAPFFWYQTRKILGSAIGLLADSRALGQVLQQKYGSKPFFEIPNVVDTDLFFPPKQVPSEPEAFHFLHASTMGYQKHTDGIIEAFLACRQKMNNPALFLYLLGPTDHLADYGYSQQDLLAEGVMVCGNLPYKEVAAYMQKSDAFVLFSRYENLPCVILEARCCGLPVISTDVGGIRYHIDPDVDLLIATEDKEALENAMILMIQNRYKFNKQKIADKAQKEYNRQSIAKKYDSAYSEIFKNAHKIM